MIRLCTSQNFGSILEIINDGAQTYRGVIPEDCWREQYMPETELAHEIAAGVVFWGYEQAGKLVGVMGIQPVKNVTLIRHAYVRSEYQGRGTGSRLLAHLRSQTNGPVLIGAWADARWAIKFYERHGFRLVDPATKEELLRAYWTVSDRQIETSVVLVDGYPAKPE